MDDLKTTINIPPRIAELAQDQIQQGWFSDLNSLIVEALRRYLEAHAGEMIEASVWKDVEWGLHGEE